ncbi:MAG: HD domain-containing protein [Planctomycetes bacterium]|nr:HD domain-containing protein [Planctomycetota bacterium]
MPRQSARELAKGQKVEEVYLLAQCQLKTSRRGSDYLDLEFRDRSGDIRGKKWETTREEFEGLAEGAYVRVRGVVEAFQGSPQLRVEAIELVDPGSVDPGDFAPVSPADVDRMWGELVEIYLGLANPHLAALFRAFFADKAFCRALRQAPAASRNHHSYVGGLLEHVLSLARVADAVARHYEALDHDLLLAGVFLHDVGKVRELDPGPGFPFTVEGELVGHVVLGVTLLDEMLATLPDFPPALRLQLVHLVLSHHGEREWGAPVVPKTLEGLVLHQLDNLDAKVHMYLRAVSGPGAGLFTSWEKNLGGRMYRGEG